MVESTALEMRHTCKGIVGSNPTLSAILNLRPQGFPTIYKSRLALDAGAEIDQGHTPGTTLCVRLVFQFDIVPQAFRG